MKSIWQKLHKVGDILHLPDLPKWLLGLLALVFILRVPSFFEPYYYGDEMIYLSLGQGARQGLTLYKDVHDNKPPLLYWTAAIAENLFWFKAILAIWSLVSIIAFSKLAQLIFPKSDRSVITATSIFAILTTIPLFEGNIVNSELFMIGLTIFAFLLLLSEKLNTKKLFWAGFLFGIATLFKVPAMFDVPVIVVYWLITGGFRDWRKVLGQSLVLLAGFVLPIGATFIWYFVRGALPEYFVAAFMQNVGYVSSFRPSDVQKSFLARNAPLLVRALVVALGVGVIAKFRKKISPEFTLLCLWVLFGLFAATLSERPYPHYLVQVLAPVSLLFSMLIHSRNFEQVLTIFPLGLFFFVPVYFNFWVYPVTGYYMNFAKFAAGVTNKQEYFQTFGKNVNRNYEIAEFASSSVLPNERIFMWDPDSSIVYALSRHLPPTKYVADYHINDFSSKAEIADILSKNPPKFIILTSDREFDELLPLIRRGYILIREFDSAQVFSRVNFDR